MAEITVQDDGEEIGKELRPVLFDPFVRGDSARQTKGGTGLGLAIAGKIVEKHGGDIRYVRQDNENIFTVTLENIEKTRKTTNSTCNSSHHLVR